MLKAGDLAPLDIVVTTQSAQATSLRQYLGRRVIVYFYPKDDTPGCTTEACGIRDQWPQFQTLGIEVLGVSPDGEASHQKFIAKYQLPFTLLADPQHLLAEAFGAWGEKNMYGKKSMGIIRSTFILESDGKILKVYPKVKTEGHAEQLLEALRAL